MKNISLLSLMSVTASLSFAAMMSDNHLLDTVTRSSAYQKYVQGKDYVCYSVREMATTQDAETGLSFQMIALDCSLNPHDGGDSMKERGWAVVRNDGEVMSFSSSYLPQAD